MRNTCEQILRANAIYAGNFNRQSSGKPRRRFAVLTCMDARLDPVAFLGLAEGDAHIIRNAGGRASDDAIRSLLISHYLMDTREWFVVHHTDCGMAKITDDSAADLIGRAAGDAAAAKQINWLTMSPDATSLADDVARLVAHRLTPAAIRVHGFIFDCATGLLHKKIDSAGKAS